MSEVKVSVQEVSPVEKRIEVAVSAKMVDKAYADALKKIGKRAKVPGFRQGKIPTNVVEKMFGAQIADEVALQVINDTYFNILKEHNIRAIDMPKVTNDSAQKGTEFKYTATVETLPPVELKAYKGIEAKIEKMAVGDDAVDNAIQHMRESKAELVEVSEARPIQRDDFAIIDLEGYENGKLVGELTSKGFTVPVGGQVIFPEIEQALEGMKVGETKEMQVTVPPDVQNKKLAGKTFNFKFTVQGLKEKSLPAVDDEFAKDLGEYESLDDLKKKVRADLEKHLEDRVRSTKRERALDALIAANPVEVPAGLVAKETDSLVHRAFHEYQNAGIDSKQLDSTRMWAQFRPVAERNIRTELLLDAIAGKENIQIDEAAMNAFFEEEAARRGASADAIKRAYMQAGADLKDRLRLEKALQLLVSEAKWKEVEPAAGGPGAE